VLVAKRQFSAWILLERLLFYLKNVKKTIYLPIQKFDYIPFEATIPGILYRKRASDRDEFVFESENVSLTSEKIKNEVKAFF